MRQRPDDGVVAWLLHPSPYSLSRSLSKWGEFQGKGLSVMTSTGYTNFPYLLAIWIYLDSLLCERSIWRPFMKEEAFQHSSQSARLWHHFHLCFLPRTQFLLVRHTYSSAALQSSKRSWHDAMQCPADRLRPIHLMSNISSLDTRSCCCEKGGS